MSMLKRAVLSCLLALVMVCVSLDAGQPTPGAGQNLDAGQNHCIFRDATGRVYTWGEQLPNNGKFQIDLDYKTSLTATQRNAFEAAAARWAQVITTDLPDVVVAGLPVDDVLITVRVAPDDGPGGRLGFAGPRFIFFNTSTVRVATGEMSFDSDDLAVLENAGLLEATVLHEMGHVLGIGSLWSFRGLVQGAGTSNPRYIGAAALAEYRAIFQTTSASIPVENTGGPGTADVHWRDVDFDNEIMSGYLNLGTNPLSRISVAALKDLGYTVNMAAADAYTPSANRPGSGDTATAMERPVMLRPEITAIEIDEQPAEPVEPAEPTLEPALDEATVGAISDGATIDMVGSRALATTIPAHIYTTARLVLDTTDNVDLSAGNGFSIVRKANGDVLAWGRGTLGQLGRGYSRDSSTVSLVTRLSGVSTLSAGGSHVLTRDTAGNMKVWGNNSSGELGNNSTVGRNLPGTMAGTYIVFNAVSAGDNFSLGLKAGVVYSWGNGANGRLGSGSTANRITANRVSNSVGILTGISKIAAGGSHGLALATNGTVWAWGRNHRGQVGDGSRTDRVLAVQVRNPNGSGTLSNVIDIAAGASHSMALLSDGTVVCWGDNSNGQLGIGRINVVSDQAYSTLPTKVLSVSAGSTAPLIRVIGIDAGGNHSHFTMFNYAVYSVGQNNVGQLGDGTTTDRSRAVMTIGPAPADAAVAPPSAPLDF